MTVKPEIEIKYDETTNSITFSTTNFAHYVYIYLPNDTTLHLSDNFFDLTPGWAVTTTVLSKHKLSEIKDKIKIKSVWDTEGHK